MKTKTVTPKKETIAALKKKAERLENELQNINSSISKSEKVKIDKLVKELLSNPAKRVQPNHPEFAKHPEIGKEAKQFVSLVKKISVRKPVLTYFYEELYRLASIAQCGLKEVKPPTGRERGSTFESPYLIYMEKEIFYNTMMLVAYQIRRHVIEGTPLGAKRKKPKTIDHSI